MVTIDDFKQLNFSKNLMTDGLVFVWVEKDIISELIKFFESQDMIYVENVCWVMLDEAKKEGKPLNTFYVLFRGWVIIEYWHLTCLYQRGLNFLKKV